MATKLHFCPKCETLLSYMVSSDDETVISCSNCSFQEPLKTGQTLRTSIYGNTQTAKITKAAIYDPSLRISSTLKCPNRSCDSNDVAKLGTRNKDGRLIQPEMSITNFTSANRENTYICRICESTCVIRA